MCVCVCSGPLLRWHVIPILWCQSLCMTHWELKPSVTLWRKVNLSSNNMNFYTSLFLLENWGQPDLSVCFCSFHLNHCVWRGREGQPGAGLCEGQGAHCENHCSNGDPQCRPCQQGATGWYPHPQSAGDGGYLVFYSFIISLLYVFFCSCFILSMLSCFALFCFLHCWQFFKFPFCFLSNPNPVLLLFLLCWLHSKCPCFI